jgi:hypothetical protein
MHEFSPDNLRNPARSRRAGLMRQFRSGQLDSSLVNLYMYILVLFSKRGAGSSPLIGYGFHLENQKFQIECVCVRWDRPMTGTAVLQYLRDRPVTGTSAFLSIPENSNVRTKYTMYNTC